ncbi:trypsin-like peptidase domain-containing protein [Bradyrhizobium sp. 193]|uniref:trypsin-like serine peptidase n=1 Tax=unclassified Bradyrhizobium TaxID=2631580 RepID=UPI001FFC0EF8|nr:MULTISPECIES: trypsin-like peptidase domain-containing protein [unclassified Bradyrhizobium]MCK1484292.1 trypsin-like peptidase domain-containing protein [Bradyrhizobium sp. 193]MCK1707502.1 trypsin-like peptidase domain-containing protein [Bradyrhizobium sp. 146]
MDHAGKQDAQAEMISTPFRHTIFWYLAITLASLWSAPTLAQNQSNPLVIVPNRLSNSFTIPRYQDIVRDVQRTGQTNLQIDAPSSSLPGAKGITGAVSQVSTVSSALDVFLTDSANLKASADEIARIVSNEPADRHSVLYDLQKRYQSSNRPYKLTIARSISDFVISTDTFGPVAPVQTQAVAAPLPVNEAIAADLKQAAGSPVRWFDEKSAQLMASTTVLESAAVRSPVAAPLSKTYANVVSQFIKAVGVPADAEATQGYINAAAKFKLDYAAQWPKIKNDAIARQAAADAYNGLARQRVLKAQYGAMTNFPPLSYEQVFHFSRYVVSLRDGSGNICSGIAISRRWIVSAGHCFTNRSWRDVRVQFDLDGLGKASRPLQILDQWPDPAPGSKNADPIDFAFLRIEEDSMVSAAYNDLESKVHAQPYNAEPLCLQSVPVTYRQPVFAVGHPMGLVKTVHDYAYVWFPFKIDEELYNRMGSEIFAQAYKIEKEIGRTSYAESVKKEFEAAYGKTERIEDQVFRYYFDATNGSALRPSFGIDTDTSGGDSGAPVFDRASRCLVGIFSGGQRDTLSASEVSWRLHEIATPISEILKHMRSTNRTQTAGNRVLDADELAARDELLSRLNEVSDLR